jgi:large subunit ribosomal protein L23
MAFNLFKTTKPVKAKKAPTKKAETVSEVALVPKENPVLIVGSSAVLHPYVSEKASRMENFNQYMFKVARTANKPEVKKAIQNRFKVKVVAVNMINMPSKKRTVGRHVGTKSGFRKAIVTLAEGDTINSVKA